MKLKENSVYIPKEKIKRGKNWYELYSNTRSKDRYKQIVAEKMELICLSKEELIEFLSKFYNSGFDRSTFLCKVQSLPHPDPREIFDGIPPTEEELINQLIDNTKQ